MAQLAGALADHLRQAFLASVAPDLVAVPGAERAQVEDLARKMGLPAVVRYMEVLGQAQVDMREAPDQRVHLEVVLIRLTHPEADDSPAALLERIERLERAQGQGSAADHAGDPVDRPRRPAPSPGTGPTGGQSPPAPETPAPETPRPDSARPRRAGPRPAVPETADPQTARSQPADPESAGADPVPSVGTEATGPEQARRALGAVKRPPAGRNSGGRTAVAATPVLKTPPREVGTTEVSRDELVQLWGDSLLASLPGRARARFRVGRFVAVEAGTAVFALPNETHRSYCEDVRIDVEAALGDHFGTPVPLRLVVDAEAEPEGPPRSMKAADQPEPPDIETEHDTGHHELLDPAVLAAETEPAGAGLSPEERLKQAFPGAEEV
jgi:DNA polymerase-3 subunit gamma/tau